jgi:hypothetical protein
MNKASLIHSYSASDRPASPNKIIFIPSVCLDKEQSFFYRIFRQMGLSLQPLLLNLDSGETPALESMLKMCFLHSLCSIFGGSLS